MGTRGGARPGAGRPKKAKAALIEVRKSIASRVLDDPGVDVVAVFKSVLYSPDPSIRLAALIYLCNRAEGMPAQSIGVANLTPDGLPNRAAPLPALNIQFVAG